MASIVLYGIENCDQVRRTRQWLKSRGIEYRFHDFRRDGLTAALLSDWLSHVPWDALLNRRGMTWRKLSEEERARIIDQSAASQLMLAQPSVIKRPVLKVGDHLLVGFSEPVYLATLVDVPKTPAS